jgi:D-glycero-alpha-D-manno-heptose-7-phosphate kinase
MADSVDGFRESLEAGDYAAIGKLLHSGWLLKKSLASKVSNPVIDALYDAGLETGAWGGKILGAGGGGCILFVAPPEKHDAVRRAVHEAAAQNALGDFLEIPVKFSQSGTEVLFNGDHHHHGFE